MQLSLRSRLQGFRRADKPQFLVSKLHSLTGFFPTFSTGLPAVRPNKRARDSASPAQRTSAESRTRDGEAFFRIEMPLAPEYVRHLESNVVGHLQRRTTENSCSPVGGAGQIVESAAKDRGK